MLVGALVLGAPTAPAAAGVVTQTNACTWFTGQRVPVDVTLSGAASPNSPAYLDPVSLRFTKVSGGLPWWAATVAYEAGLIKAGPNTIPLRVSVTIGARNATPASQTLTATATASVNFNPNLDFTPAAQAGQIIAVTDLALPNSSWTRTGQHAVAFRQTGMTVRATFGTGSEQTVLSSCNPATWSTGDTPVATPVEAPPFESVGVSLPPAAFTDVPYGHQFFVPIEWVADQEIAGGYDDGAFRPTAAVTRQAFMAFLYRAAGSPPFTPPTTASFVDVSPSHPFFLAVEWARSEGIAGGYADRTFRPGAVVTRQAASQWLMSVYAGPVSPPTTPPFPDVSVGHPFATAIAWMVREDITTGYANGLFQPTSVVSRQAAAAWFHRAIL